MSWLLATAVLAACAARTPAPPPPDPAAFPGDSALFAVLAADPGPDQLAAFDRYEAARGVFLTDTLAELVDDTTVHPLLRANALLLIGRRTAIRHMMLVPGALRADDVRLRLAAVAALREFLPARPEPVTTLLGLALADASPAVQARALEALADREPALLRDYLATSPPAELGRVARDLIAVAEERGAPLEPSDSSGRLERTGAGGHRLLYQPAQQWASWELSTGPLRLIPAGGEPVLLDTVEVAGRVVPAFFSADGRWLVYEARRTIHVHDVMSGTTREIGAGIAPRVFPFTDTFLFLREIEGGRQEMRSATRIQYELLRVPFAPAPEGVTEPERITTVSANAGFAVRGGASPVRWVRVLEQGPGMFALAGSGFPALPLPDPFERGAPGS